MHPFDTYDLMAVGFLLERERGVQHSSFEEKRMAEAGLVVGSGEKVAAQIWAALEEATPVDWRCSAYWALGKRYSEADKDRFVAALRVEVSRSAEVAYQIMIALDNLREPVFSPDRKSRSATEASQNLADAKRYLASRP